jgi:nitrogen regulatory protein PII
MVQTKLICIVKPFRLDPLVAALDALEGVEHVLLTEVRGYGRQKGHLDLYRGSEYDLTFLPKVCLEVYLTEDASVEDIKREITQISRTGRIGDGKILQLTVEPG